MASRFTIVVKQARNIRGSKGEKVTSFVRVQFAEFDPQDSPVVADSPNPSFQFHANLDLKPSETLVDTFLNAKITVTLIEQLPKDKQLILGTAELPVGQFFFQTTPLSEATTQPLNTYGAATIPIVYANSKMLVDTAASNQKLLSSDNTTGLVPDLDVEVMLDRPLIEESELAQGNFLTIRPWELLPVPEEWSHKDAVEKDLNSNLYYYTLNFNIPASLDQDRPVSIYFGQLIGPNETLPGDTTPPQEQAVAQKRVRWPTGRKFWMSPGALKALREHSVEKQGIDAELVRVFQPKYAHLTDSNASRYRGRFSIDVSNLLYPDTKSIEQRCSVMGFDNEYPSGLNMASARESKDGKTKSANTYKALGTQVQLTLSLNRPLLEKKSIPIITKKVHDFVPKRELPEDLLQAKRAHNADQRFHQATRTIVSQLCGELVRLFQHDIERTPEGDMRFRSGLDQERTKQLMQHLTKGGIYQQLKEKLKASVVDVVRERFKHVSPFATQAALQENVNRVYVYLVDEMHKELNQLFQKQSAIHPAQPAEAADTDDVARLQEFAEEAEGDGEFAVAAFYHLERLAKDEDNLQLWYEYACFCLRTGAVDRGNECLREVISRNQRSVSSLLAYAAQSTMNRQFDQAQTLFYAVVQMQPTNTLALAMQVLFYGIAGNELEADRITGELRRAQMALKQSTSPYMQVVDFGLKIHAVPFVERALAMEMIDRRRHVTLYLKLAQLYCQSQNMAEAEKQVHEALSLQLECPEAWSMLGRLYYMQKRYDDAKSAYESLIAYGKDSPDIVQVYIRLARIYLYSAMVDPEDYSKGLRDREGACRAKSALMEAAKRRTTTAVWLGLGLVCWLLSEYEEAEDALAEASVLSSRNCDVWALVALVCLSKDKVFEATRAMAHALRHGLHDRILLRAAAVMFDAKGESRTAEACQSQLATEDPTAILVNTYQRLVRRAGGPTKPITEPGSKSEAVSAV
ncbi:hypothetical protein RI367_006926 [Sorochytrium milnesiophthora]